MTVEPIKDDFKQAKFEAYLRSRSERDFVLWCVGVYTGLRLSDFIRWRVSDVRGKDYVDVVESKTSKRRRVAIDNPELKEILQWYCADLPGCQYLFKSKKDGKGQRPLSRQAVYAIQHKAGLACGLPNVGSHTMRKTFAWNYISKAWGTSDQLMRILNHSCIQITFEYAGIAQERINESLRNVSYGR